MWDNNLQINTVHVLDLSRAILYFINDHLNLENINY